MKKSLVYSIGAQIVAAAGSFVFQWTIARQFGAEGTGLFFSALMFVMVASVLGRLGMDNVITRHIAIAATRKDGRYMESVISIARKAGLIASILALLVALSVYLLWKQTTEGAVLFGAIPLLVLTAIYAAGLRGAGAAWAYPLLLQAMVPVVIMAMWLLGIRMDWPVSLKDVYSCYLMAAVITVATAYFLWARKKTEIGRKAPEIPGAESFSWQQMWNGCRHLYPVAILNLAVFPWAAILFLTIFSTSEQVGIYSVVNRIVSQLGFVLVAVGNVVSPRFAALYEQGDLPALEQLARKSALFVTALALPVIIALYLADQWVLGFFGPEFVHGVPLMDIMLMGAVVHVVTGNVGVLLMMCGYEKETKIALVVSAGVLVMSAAILVPLLQGMGAAISYTLAIVIQNLLLTYYVVRRIGISPIVGLEVKYVR